MKPTLWIFDPDKFQCRIEFRFVKPDGSFLASKTWAICQRDSDPPKTYLLQAHARLAGSKPNLYEASQNYYVLTAKVFSLEGLLNTAAVTGDNPADFSNQLAAFPLSFAVVVDRRRLGFQLYVARAKPL